MSQKIIIFEGADKSGKSTIAKEVSKRTGISIFKATRQKRWWDPMVSLLYLTEGLVQFVEQIPTSVIFDRFHGSDYMYSKLFDRDVSFRKIWEIDERMAKLGALIVICYKQPSAYIADEEDADVVDPSMYTRMTELMKEFEQQSKCNFLLLDTTDQNLEEQVNKILCQI